MEKEIEDTAYTSIEHYILDVNKVDIQDKGLGEFTQGFTEEYTPFNWVCLWWNLIPYIGQFFFIFYLLRYWWVRSRPKRVIMYKNGFIVQTLDGKGRIRKEMVVKYQEVKGMLCNKTLQYINIYGIPLYNGTVCVLSTVDCNNDKKEILRGLYRNKKEIEGHYNFIGYACNAINKVWTEISIHRLEDALASNGSVTFISSTGEVEVSRDFIKANGLVVRGLFRYMFDDEYISIYPREKEDSQSEQKKKCIAINITDMYNREAFLTAFKRLDGMRFYDVY